MNEIERARHSTRRRNAHEWAQRLQQFEASGQQPKGFCRDQGLAPSTFSYWRRRLRKMRIPDHRERRFHGMVNTDSTAT
jgi:hypothetical protein